MLLHCIQVFTFSGVCVYVSCHYECIIIISKFNDKCFIVMEQYLIGNLHDSILRYEMAVKSEQ